MKYYALGLIMMGLVIGTGTLCIACKNYRKHLLLISSMLTFLIAVIVYHKYLIGTPSFLYSCSDGFYQFLPIYTDFIHTLKEGNGFPLWNFSIGFGATQSYLRFIWPTNLIPILSGAIGGEQALVICAAWMQVVRMVLSTVFMFMFLKKLNINDFACANMSVAYALCGILIIRGHWWSIGDECYIALFILWSAECYFKDKKWYFVPISVALLASYSGIYYIYLYGLELFIYATVRYAYEKKAIKEYFKYIFVCGMLYFFGVLIASIMVFDSGRTMFGTARYITTRNGVGVSDYIDHMDFKTLLSTILSAFDVNSCGVFYSYTGALNLLERPILYCGIGCIFFILQGLILGEKRTKKLIIFGIMVAGLYFLFPIVSGIFNLFIKNEEMGVRSYRLSTLWIVIIMIVMSGYGLDRALRKKSFNKAGILFTGIGLIVLFFFCLICAPRYGITVEYNVCKWVFVFLLLWMVVLIMYNGEKGKKIFKVNGMIILIGITVLEMGHSAKITIGGSQAYARSAYAIMEADALGYYSDVADAVRFIKNYDNGFYRIAGIRPVLGTYCSPMYFGVYDSSYYANINDKTYEFLDELYPESFINNLGTKYSVGVGDDLNLSTLTGYKYLVKEKNGEYEVPHGYKYLISLGNISIYENTLSLSLGVTYNAYMKESVFKKYSDEEQRKLLLHCVVLDDGVNLGLEELPNDEIKRILSDVTYTQYDRCVNERMTEAFDINSWKEDHIVGKATILENKVMMFSVPNVKGWHIYVDGVEKKIFQADIGFMAVELTKGEHLVELVYEPKTFKLSIYVSLIAVLVYIVLLFTGIRLGKRGRLNTFKYNI